MVLAPSSSVEGETLLRYRIADVDEALMRGDVTLNWCDRFTPVGEGAGGHLAGAVNLRKSV